MSKFKSVFCTDCSDRLIVNESTEATVSHPQSILIVKSMLSKHSRNQKLSFSNLDVDKYFRGGHLAPLSLKRIIPDPTPSGEGLVKQWLEGGPGILVTPLHTYYVHQIQELQVKTKLTSKSSNLTFSTPQSLNREKQHNLRFR